MFQYIKYILEKKQDFFNKWSNYLKIVIFKQMNLFDLNCKIKAWCFTLLIDHQKYITFNNCLPKAA